MIFSLTLLLPASFAVAQQSATPSLQPAVAPKYAGVFSPATRLVNTNQDRGFIAEVYNNTLMSNYYTLGPGPDQEWIDNFILEDVDGTPAAVVEGMEFIYCSSDTNPSGIGLTFTLYDESIYCAGPTNWPVADCSYQMSGLPGGNNGALACWIILLDLDGVECNLTDGHGGHAGWGQIWDNSSSGPWLAGGGNGQTPTFTWFDHTQPPGSAFQGCQSMSQPGPTGFNMKMYSDYGGCGYCLTTTGTPGGPMTFDVAGGTPNGIGAYLYAFGQGSHQAHNPVTGNTLTTGLASAGFTIAEIFIHDGGGAYSHPANVPAAAAGLVSVQVADGITDGLSNVVDL